MSIDMRPPLVFLVAAFLCGLPNLGQTQTTVPGKGYLVPAVVVGKDTFPSVWLADVVIVSKRQFASYVDEYRFNQLKQNIITVYPYAKKAGVLFREIRDSLSSMDRRRDRRKYIHSKETQLDDELSAPLKNLTITQGKILVKLISRETGENVYDIIKEYKSGTKAFYWNTMGRFLGYDLKEDYDPQQDRDIEIIMRSLEGNTQL